MTDMMRLYVIKDRVAETNGPVFEAVNDGVAMRAFRSILAKEITSPDEYDLILVGIINKKDLTLREEYKVVANGSGAIPQDG